MKKYFHEIDNEQNIKIYNESWYLEDGILYPSVTFIQNVEISYGILKWTKQHGIYTDEILEQKKSIGSLLHKIIEDYYRNGFIEYYDYEGHPHLLNVWKRIPNFINFDSKVLDDCEILGIEETVINKELNYAGTLDLRVRINDHIHIFDWKSSDAVQEHHKSQIAAYSKCVGADYAHVVCFPENPRTKQGFSMSTLDKNDIDEKFEDFLDLKNRFNKKTKQPLFKTLPTKFERE